MVSLVSMVIHVIHMLDIGPDEPERDPPVLVHPYGPVSFQLALEQVQPKRREVQVLRSGGHVQRTENAGLIPRVCGLDTFRRAGMVEPFESFVPEPDNHPLTEGSAARSAPPPDHDMARGGPRRDAREGSPVGHADLATTMKYTHLAREHLRRLVDEADVTMSEKRKA